MASDKVRSGHGTGRTSAALSLSMVAANFTLVPAADLK